MIKNKVSLQIYNYLSLPEHLLYCNHQNGTVISSHMIVHNLLLLLNLNRRYFKPGK